MLNSVWNGIREDYCLNVYSGHVEEKSGLGPHGEITDELWESVLKSLKRDASPGVDLCYEYKTNAHLLEGGDDKLRAMVQQRIYDRLAFYRTAQEAEPKKSNALQLVEDNLQDPIRVFGKNESTGVHKPTRVINSVSVVDSGVERVLSLATASKFSDNWMEGPSSVGIQLKNLDALVEFRSKAERYLGSSVVVDDMQGYEYSFKDDCVDMAFDIEVYLHAREFYPRVEEDVYVKLLFVENWLTKAPSIIVCSDGVVLETAECWLRSGRFKTSFYGTHVRSALCSVAASMKGKVFEYMWVPAKSNGDDCLSSYVGYELDYVPYGFVVTDRRLSTGIEPWSFCSHLIFRDTHYPETVCKTILNLLRNRKVTHELYDAFAFVNRERPDWPILEEFISRLISEAEASAGDLLRVEDA